MGGGLEMKGLDPTAGWAEEDETSGFDPVKV